MFNKKRKSIKYKFKYGKSPSLTKRNFSRNRYSSKKLLTRTHPFITKIKKLAISLSIILLTIFVIYGLLFSNYFKISEISVSDEINENPTLAKEIQSILYTQIGKSLIFADTEDLKIKIFDSYPEIQDIEIEKDYPNKIIIIFKEHPLVANVINQSNTLKKSYIINSIGYAIKEDKESPNLPYIKIQSDEPLNPENPIIEANKLRYILETIIYFEDKFGMRVIEVIYKKTPREIHLLTERNFYIWLDMQQEADEQLKKLKKALVKLDIYNENLEYIDLRIAEANGDKIIYKRK
jgi:cell division septal protein FtsQ